MDQSEPKSLQQIASDTRYPLDAFHFVRRVLDYTVHSVHVDPDQLDEVERHVSGQQFCEGLQRFAVDQYGLLARTVLRRWRINRTEDLGQIVFAMVDGGLMQATENDTLHDFDGVFDLDQALVATVPVENVTMDEPDINWVGQG